MRGAWGAGARQTSLLSDSTISHRRKPSGRNSRPSVCLHNAWGNSRRRGIIEALRTGGSGGERRTSDRTGGARSSGARCSSVLELLALPWLSSTSPNLCLFVAFKVLDYPCLDAMLRPPSPLLAAFLPIVGDRCIPCWTAAIAVINCKGHVSWFWARSNVSLVMPPDRRAR